MRFDRLIAPAIAALALSACNAAQQPQIVPPGPSRVAPLPDTAGGYQTPAGSGCAGAVSRYQAVVDNDLRMGHVNKSVHAQIMGEISEANGACSSGQDARAMSLIRASKSRHGYPG
jgi:hypothetical protein